MKMIKIAFSYLLFISLFSSSLIAQSESNNRFWVGGGYGTFVPSGDIESDKIILSNGVNSGSGSVSHNIEGINLAMGYEKLFTPKWSLGVGLNYLQKEGVFNDERKTMIGQLEIDHRSNSELKAFRGDFLGYFNFLPNSSLNVKIGLGPSIVYREHFYRDYVEFDVSDEVSVLLVDQTFTTSKEVAGGLTGQLQVNYPISDQISVGLNATHSLYFNSDYGSSINLLLGYSF